MLLVSKSELSLAATNGTSGYLPAANRDRNKRD
jgi:hypothetical protein